MERITKSLEKEFRSVRLYRDDIEKVLSMLDDIKAKGILLQTDEIKYEREEFDKVSDHLVNLRQISSVTPYLSLRFYEFGGGRLYIDTDSYENKWLHQEIEKLLESRERKIILFLTRPPLWIVPLSMIIGTFGICLIFYVTWVESDSIWELTPLFGLFFSILVSSTIWLPINSGNEIISTTRKATPNYWNRNKDQLINTLIGAVLGALFAAPLGALATLWIIGK